MTPYNSICETCGNWTTPSWGRHNCISKGGLVKKKWSHSINAWVLDTDYDGIKTGHQHYDAQTNTWVDNEPTDPSERTKSYTVASCEIPIQKVGQEERVKQLVAGPDQPNTTTTWTPCRPWEGVDRTKWPYTWWTLLMLYYSDKWHTEGKYIDDSDYRDRVFKGIYRPEPKKYEYHPGKSHYGPYGNAYSEYGDHD